jgi:hypothetical protein
MMKKDLEEKEQLSSSSSNKPGSMNISEKKETTGGALSLKCNAICKKLKEDGKKIGCLSSMTKKPKCCNT